MKTHILLVAVVALSACTHTASVTASSPVLTSVWGGGEPESPIGDGTQHTTEQATNAATATSTTGSTITASAHGAPQTKSADMAEGDATHTGSVGRDNLPRALYFTPRPINTGDPCGDCARAR